MPTGPLHPVSPSLLLDNIDIYDSEYGLWRPVYQRHAYRGVKLARIAVQREFAAKGSRPKESDYPRPLDPVDDLPPATVITHVANLARGKLLVRADHVRQWQCGAGTGQRSQGLCSVGQLRRVGGGVGGGASRQREGDGPRGGCGRERREAAARCPRARMRPPAPARASLAGAATRLGNVSPFLPRRCHPRHIACTAPWAGGRWRSRHTACIAPATGSDCPAASRSSGPRQWRSPSGRV